MSESRSTTIIPNPDPSAVTVQRLDQAATAIREELASRLIGLRELIEARLTAFEQSLILVRTYAEKRPGEIETRITLFKELTEEKFIGIQTQFRERDIRTDQDKIAASTAVNAALQAQKEAAAAQNEANAKAIEKSENGFTKEIDGLKTLIAATKDTLQVSVQNVTGRLDRGEGNDQGARQNRDDGRNAVAVYSAVALGILALIVSISFGVFNRSQYTAATTPPTSAIAVVPVNPK